MITTISPRDFLDKAQSIPIIDVRAPQEFAHGHIPKAHSVPLFSDTERALVGTVYKQQGKEAAIKVGLECIAPHMRTLVEQIEILAPEKKVRVHCWRGGMRSSSVAWLLNLFGFEVYLLRGGYKAFKAYMREQFALSRSITIIGGPTGTGKTDIIQALMREHQAIDLEALACHKGSVFGARETVQSTQEQFENNLGTLLARSNPQKYLFIEDESRKIGTLMIPEHLWTHMRTAPVIHIIMPREERIERLVQEYGALPVTMLCSYVKQLERRIGGARCTEIVTAITNGDLQTACALLLDYYDATYAHGMSKRNAATITPLMYDSKQPIQELIARIDQLTLSLSSL